MRNLKKALSMALALVMMLGMLTVASAKTAVADFIDLDKISAGQKEAIMLLIDLGIVEGIQTTDGKYEVSPEAKIDRNSYAKIVFMALQATSDASPYMGGSTLKGVTGTWAEGYVNFLASLKCVAGDLEGNFNGSDNLTIAQACKIMLAAMGYDAIHRGYEQDANWSINIMRDAQRFGLMEGVGQAATAEITRENAFRVIYNALFATSVTPIKNRDMGEWIVTGYENDNTLGLKAYNLVKVTANLGGVGSISNFTIAAPAQIKEGTAANFNLPALKTAAEKAYPVGPNDVGGKFTFYAKVSSYPNNNVAGATFTLYSAKATSDTGNVLSTTYGNKTIDKLLSAYGNTDGDGKDSGYVAKPASGVRVYINGVAGTLEGTGAKNHADDYVIEDGDGAVVSIARGAIVDLIANSDGDISVIRVTQKSAAVISANPTTNSDGEVKIPGILSDFDEDYTTDNVFGWEDVKKGDVALYVEIGGDLYIEKAVRVEGEAKNRNGDGSITLEGTKYFASALTISNSTGISNYRAWNADTNPSAIAASTQYALHLDNGKNIVGYETLSEDVSSNYAFVLETAWVAGTGIGASNYAQAKLLFTDGTTDVVTVKAANGDTSLVKADWDEMVPGDAPKGTISQVMIGKFVNFKVDTAGKYTLTDVSGVTNLNLATFKYTKGARSIVDNGNNVKATVNANTVFILAVTEGDKTVYTTSTGIANTPSFSIDSVVGNSSAIIKNGFATFVYAKATLTASKGQLVYIDLSDYSVNEDDLFVYPNVYVDGKKVTGGALFETQLTTTGANGTIKVIKGGLYKVFARDGDVIVSLGNADNTAASLAPTNLFTVAGNVAPITAVDGGVLVVNGVDYDVDEETVVLVVKSDMSLAVSSIGDMVVTPANPTNKDYNAYVVSNSDGYATTVYLVYGTYPN